ncbi:flightin isoform X1 [Bombyx mandarina]|uniref:Flightin isoform X1 n=1 Tax=Bombyx mandarina TaxID=7092 RepID=A0A6J2K1D3_BOMMA|nr:flightin isoform X1 [Bombyx mandarina]
MWDDVEDETPEQPEPVPEEAPAASEAEPGKEGAQQAKPEEAEPPPPENPNDSSEPRRLVFKHWCRPKFLQYNYIYDYQKNYYDDLITYLDRRNKGQRVEPPRAQTWGERALRTYLANRPITYTQKSKNQDQSLLHHISVGAKFQRYHTKSLISRKYSNLGFTSVSI